MEENKITNPFSKLFNITKEATNHTEPNGNLAIDLYEKNNSYHIITPIAGVQPDDIELELNEDFVIIKGQRQTEQSHADQTFIYQECYWGTFERQINFPSPVDPENATATFKDGMLFISAPKVKSTRTRTLKIKTL